MSTALTFPLMENELYLSIEEIFYLSKRGRELEEYHPK